MASSFLKKKAREEAEKIEKKYGSSAYGGVTWLEQQLDEELAPVKHPTKDSKKEEDIAPVAKANTEREQRLASFSGVINNDDFLQNSGYKSTSNDRQSVLEKWFNFDAETLEDYGDLVYEYINNKGTVTNAFGGNKKDIRSALLSKNRAFSSDNPYSDGESVYEENSYDFMTEEEVAIYNYFYNTEGKEKADEYLGLLTETLNSRKAGQRFENIEGSTTKAILFGIESGTEQAKQGVNNLINMASGEDDYIPYTSTQILSGMVREDLADDGFEILGNSLGQVAYDALSTASNMAPSIMLSTYVSLINPKAGKAVGSALMGAQAAGNAYQEALNQGYSKEAASAYAKVVGASEGGLQYAIGGIGKLGGTSKYLSNAISGIENGVLRFIAKHGANVISEASEEALQEILNPLFKNAMLGADEDVNWSDVAYSGFLGGLMGGLMGGDGGDTTLTKNEKAVVDKVYQDELAKAEENGKVSAREKTKIYNEVIERMEKGDISTDTIEEVLSGDNFKAYKDILDSENALKDEQKALQEEQKALEEEYKQINPKNIRDMTGEEWDRREEIKARLPEIQTKLNEIGLKLGDTNTIAQRNVLKAQLDKDTFELAKKDRLRESYFEAVRSKQKYEADVNQYTGRAKKVIQQVMDSGLADNTNKTHEFWDMMAKMSDTMDTDVTLANDEQILEMVKADYEADGLEFDASKFEGQRIDGYISKNGIVLNAKSNRALNFVVGHEITHKLEGTGHYAKLQKLLFEYAKGEYETRFNERSGQYANKFKADEKYKSKVDKEVTGDLVGDYVFNDKGFIDQLAKDRTTFQRVWDEIKHMAKIATAGSEQARQLAKVKREFERAWREANKKQSGVQLSVSNKNIKDIHTGYASDEYYYTMSYTQDGKEVAKLDYGVYEGKPNVKMIEVDPEYRRKGIATKLLQELQKKYPDAEIEFGMTTPDGAKLLDSITYDVTDEAVVADRQKLKDLQAELDDLEARIGAFDELFDNGTITEAQRAEIEALGDRWDEVYHSINELAPTLRGKKATKTFVKTDVKFSVSEQTDKTYFDAVTNNDWETAERMVEEAAKAAGYTKAVYHGTESRFTVFDTDEESTTRPQHAWMADYPDGTIFLAEDYNVAEVYGDRVMDLYLDTTDMKVFEEPDMYAHRAMDDKYGYEVYNYPVIAVKGKDMTIYATLDNTLVKSADTITFGDGGEILPLSERFKHSDPDIRFSVSDKKIVNTLTGEEIDQNTYSVLERLDNGDTVTADELANLKEVQEGKLEMDKLVQDFIAQNPDFKDVPLDDVGTYLLNSDERIQLRRKIIDERLQEGSFSYIDNDGKEVYNGSVKNDKRLDIVIGLPASGKSSSIVNPLSQFYQSVVIDSDIIKTKLPEFNGGWGASLVHEESSLINSQLLEETMNTGKNVVLPVVGAKVKSVERYIAIAKDLGYDVNVHLNELPSGKALNRMLKRYFNEGRFIDPARTAGYGNKPTEVYEQIKQRGDISGYSRWNNDVPKGQRPSQSEISENNQVYGKYSASWRASRGEVSGRLAEAAEATKNEIAPVKQTSSKDGVFFDAPVQFSVSDASYMDAVNRGDTETAQNMVYDAAKNAGYEHQMFHETDAENIHVFDVSRGDHGATDYETPYGIFTKTSAKNIGLGSRQMPLLVKAQNTLYVENREDVRSKIPGFEQYYNQIQEIDSKYDALAEQLEDEEFDALQEWMEENPDADMDVVYPTSYIIEGKPADIDSERYQEAHRKYQENKAKWSEAYDAVAVKAKGFITEYLRNNGYDSMYFKVDGGSRGRQTDSLIVLDPNQVKSAEAVTKDDSGNVIPLSERFNADSDDTRYSISDIGEQHKDTGGYQYYSHIPGDDIAPVADVVAPTDAERLGSLTDADVPPETDTYYGEEHPVAPRDPFESRDFKGVGNRKVHAYMYDNPEVKPYFQEMANAMLGDLQNSVKGERWYNDDVYYESGGEYGWSGTERQTTDDIAYLLDMGYTYAQIEKGLHDIIEDNGAENNAMAKRIEFALNDRLSKGYTDINGYEIPANEEYLNVLAQKQTAEAVEGQIAPHTDADAPMDDIAPVKPVKETYEAIRPKPSNEPRMVRADSKGKQRKWVGTSTESDAVDGKVLPEDLDQDLIHYQPISNKKTLGNANNKLNSMGYEDSVTYMNSQFANNKVTLDDIALGERLIQEAVKRGDTKTASDLIMDISILGTELGQKVQALSIIKRLTPEGQLRMLQRTVERGKTKGDKTFEGVEITQDMIDYILKTYGKDGTYDQAELNKRVEDVKQQLADQMKITVMDYINEWRYLSMLGNPKTHIRNIVSNVAMWGTRQVKNAVARTIEDIAPVKNRTKTWKFASKDVKEFAKQAAIEEYEGNTDNKYSEGGSIKAKRQILPGVLGKASNVNSNALSAEDTFFSKPAYRTALSEYLTANGITTKADIEKNGKLVAKAKAYAMEQAKEATFQQDSYIASKISEIERKNPAFNIAVGSVLPFKKTPINVAKTAVSYSPLGFARGVYDAVQVSKGKMDASEAIDHFAQALTGTSLTLIGYALASMGVLNGAGEDDKEGEYDYQLGEQSYSFNFNGDTFSLSWLSPVAMPLFVGTNAYEQMVEGKDWNADMVFEALAQTLDPLSEMSFLSSLDSVLSSYDSGVEKFMGIFESAGQSYISQFAPTLMSQVAQATDDTKRSTKASADSDFKFGEETMNKLIYKIPGLRQTLEPTTDIWGNEVKQTEDGLTRAFESFIAPYARREDIATEIDEEIKDLYRQTGDTGLIPSIPNNYVSYDGEKYKMSAKEFTDFKKAYGQTAYDLMEQLFGTNTYQNADSETRAEMVNRVYDYARDEARKGYFAKHGVNFTNATEDGKEVYKENAIKGAIEADLPVDEYKFSEEYPEKYSFFKENGITYDDYASADEDGKRAYTWAYENPSKYTMSKAISDDLVTYRKYTGDLYDIKADKDSNGESISGSAKEKKIDYINSLDLDYGQKIILYRSLFSSKEDRATYNADILEYLNSRNDISYEDKVTILKELDFTVDSKGNVTWD